jgi:hypothetical protein
VDSGGSQIFTITPDTGFHIEDVRVDGASQGAIGSYPFADVTANHTIDAAFAPNAANTHALTVRKDGTAAGEVTSTPAGIACGTSCSGVYDSGTDVALSATADTDSTLTGWGGDCNAAGQVTMTAAKICSATFTSNSERPKTAGPISLPLNLK